MASLKWFRCSPESKTKPIILFVHHVGGSQRTVRRHVRLVNELGFNAVTFDLSFHGEDPKYVLKLDFYFQWTKEIAEAAAQIPEPKIIYAFSRPSTCALRFIASHFSQGHSDVKGFIADSGPFIVPPSGFPTMLKGIFNIQEGWRKKLTFTPMMLAWDRVIQPHIRKTMEDLARLNPKFPMLAIRGGQDWLVPPHQIERVLKGITMPNLIQHEIPECGHLNGLRDFPDEYRTQITSFLHKFYP